MGAPSPITVRVSRAFDASPERVFDAWLDPQLIGTWMFGSRLRDEEVLRVAVDARVGGAFSFLVRRGEQEIDHVGVYLAIERPRRLVFTWGIAGESSNESLVTIDIAAMPTGCELTLTHVMHPKWADYASRTQAGWTKMLDALADTLATAPGRRDPGTE
jgi:uncharacterized protein YndB with AHSA1/START domain